MKVAFAERFVRQYAALPAKIKAKVDKRVAFLLANLKHPSLRAKKYDEVQNIWQARVDRYYRFYFKISCDVYWILTVIKHPR